MIKTKFVPGFRVYLSLKSSLLKESLFQLSPRGGTLRTFHRPNALVLPVDERNSTGGISKRIIIVAAKNAASETLGT